MARACGGGLVTLKGHVGDQEGLGLGAGGGANVMFHFGQGDVRGVGVAENDHAERIADQDQGDAGGVEQLGHGKIVGGERGDAAAVFHAANGGGGDFGVFIG